MRTHYITYKKKTQYKEISIWIISNTLVFLEDFIVSINCTARIFALSRYIVLLTTTLIISDIYFAFILDTRYNIDIMFCESDI